MTASEPEQTVYIVDDDANIRKSLSLLVSRLDLHVRCFDSAERFLEAYDPEWVGCLILDMRMPGMSGFELHDRMVQNKSALPVIIISGQANIQMCVDAMKKGAFDFIEKPYRIEELGAKIRLALQLAIKMRKDRQQNDALRERFRKLDPRELVVLQKIVAGNPNKLIAESLGVSLRTVQLRRNSIMQKLGVTSRAELVRATVIHDRYIESNPDSQESTSD